MSPTRQRKKVKRRAVEDLRSMPARSAARSLARSIITPAPRNWKDFLTAAWFTWMKKYVKVVFRGRHPFLTYPGPSSDRPGIFPIPQSCKMALVGDWGTGTESAYRVMRNIRNRRKPDITIHLGDIYYSGQIDEVVDYFLGDDDWYRGKQSFALNGNHEMYSGGTGYFNYVLPALHQQTSYFCLQNAYWRIVALDTGYYSKIFPFLELYLSTKLHSENCRWLQEVVFADPDDHRPVILLSHHQWFSAFDRAYARLGKQLTPFLDQVALWFWGHEHRFAGYAPYGLDGRPRIRARCIGHGGMPVEFEEIKNREVPLVFVDERPSQKAGDQPVGICGYALLEFRGPRLIIRYIDEFGTELLVEEWRSRGRKGGTQGMIRSASAKLTWLRPREELTA
jgi:hypothetical protein